MDEVIKFLVDEDLSPGHARFICSKLGHEAISVRGRGLLSTPDHKIFELAYNEDRIIVTANIKDYEELARRSELHSGMVFLKGDASRDEQCDLITEAVRLIESEILAGRSMVNRLLYIREGLHEFIDCPQE